MKPRDVAFKVVRGNGKPVVSAESAEVTAVEVAAANSEQKESLLHCAVYSIRSLLLKYTFHFLSLNQHPCHFIDTLQFASCNCNDKIYHEFFAFIVLSLSFQTKSQHYGTGH